MFYDNNNGNTYLVLPQDFRQDCNSEDYGAAYDEKRTGVLGYNLIISKNVRTRLADSESERLSAPENIVVTAGVTLTIDNGDAFTLKYDDNYPMYPTYYNILIVEPNANLILNNSAQLILENTNHLDLKCNSNVHLALNSSIVLDAGSTFCNEGANISGQGHIVFTGHGITRIACVYCPYSHFVGDSTIVTLDSGVVLQVPDSSSMIFDGSCAELQMSPTSSIQFGKGSSIIIRNGARIVAANACFTSLDTSNISWSGIFLQNTAGDTIIDCTFSNAITALNICDTGMTVANKELIRGNIFNLSTDPNQVDYGIFAQDVLNATIDSNTFNMQGITPNIGIWFENDDNMGFPAGKSNINITNSQFTGGSQQIVLNCMASDLTPFYIAYNTFTGVENNNCVGLWARKVTGSFKYNSFSNSSYSSAVQIYQSSMNLLSNLPVQSDAYTTLFSGKSSTSQMAPILDGSGNLDWYGGMNAITTYDNDNIYFDDGSNAVVDLGQNCFTLLDTTGLYYNIEGIQNTSLFGPGYNATENVWNLSQPLFNVINDLTYSPISVNYGNTYPGCGANNLPVISSIVTDRGDGI